MPYMLMPIHVFSHLRLRDLLQSEEQQYLKDIAAKEETTLERQAKMRERAKVLKEQREAYRQEFVEQKLREQWRYIAKTKYCTCRE